MLSCILRPPLFTLLFLPLTSSNDGYRNYKDGDVIIGGLLNIHYYATSDQCTELFTTGLGYAEATIFTIEKINKNAAILPNVTIGYDLRDYCGSNARAMKMAYDLMFICNGDPVHMSNQNISIPSTGYVKETKTKTISALVGPADSGSAVLVGSLLQVFDIPALSQSATSDELSSQMYRLFQNSSTRQMASGGHSRHARAF